MAKSHVEGHASVVVAGQEPTTLSYGAGIVFTTPQGGGEPVPCLSSCFRISLFQFGYKTGARKYIASPKVE